ncbi:(d)CMP kinase [Kroppenstedtia eburnea]|uniref:Cytidylate kinase n=1 Tax=Kroppenstedtia eburnea TaxID=714067 RepID=A0A1N7IPD0_9BACL|nr:(d)CMP kinase [Kroppenstedtia eburnea]EGK14055.1 cytidylate kinase [Desmospora sp. 8437]QKI82040.1 (d)CMP kinase [Kroppenstedtia eburnea]SIS38933.1 cytidylate kinase [Kroppenstedtia eburnea]
MSRLSVAIDGPAGAGKSTVARRVAAELGLTYVDTGAMYRAITWKTLQENKDPEDEASVSRLARDTDLRLTAGKGGVDVWVDGEKVTEAIRTPEVTSQVSRIAGQAGVRKVLTDKQRAMARQGGVVMDGRDIGTQVLPNADVKVFLTASIEERAQRRHLELVRRGFEVNPEQLKEEIRNRDEKDRNREHSPLRPAEDAVHVDTTGLSIEEVVQSILHLCRSRVSGGE